MKKKKTWNSSLIIVKDATWYTVSHVWLGCPQVLWELGAPQRGINVRHRILHYVCPHPVRRAVVELFPTRANSRDFVFSEGVGRYHLKKWKLIKSFNWCQLCTIDHHLLVSGSYCKERWLSDGKILVDFTFWLIVFIYLVIDQSWTVM